MIEAVSLPLATGQSLANEPWELGSDGCLIGAFGVQATSELGIWRRLFESANVAATTILLAPEWSKIRRLEAIGTFPSSIHQSVVLVSDQSGEWQNLITPDRPERAFSAGIKQGKALLMIGAPTEEAWQRMQEHLRN